MKAVITEKELREMKKVLPEDAAKYLQGGWNANKIRHFAKEGICPFCLAGRYPGSKRYFYEVNVERLIRFKKGEIWTAA